MMGKLERMEVDPRGAAAGRSRRYLLHRSERDAIVTAYANTITCGCGTYLRQLLDPADHPVFRIEPDAAPS